MRVFIAGEQFLLRQGLENLLAANGADVVGGVATGAEVVDGVLASNPDVAR